MKHDNNSYAIYLNARSLAESALNLYHATSRGESSSFWVSRVDSDLDNLKEAIEDYKEEHLK